MCFLHLLHFVLQVAPELQGGGKRKNPAPPLLWEQRSTSWYAGTVGKTVQGLMRKVGWKGVEWTYNGMSSCNTPGWLGEQHRGHKETGSATLSGQIPTEWLKLWMSEWVSALSHSGTCLAATCTLGQVIAAASKARFTSFDLTYIAV